MGELKMSPDFIKVTNFLYEPQVAISKNQQMIDYLELDQSADSDDITQSYFLNSAEEVYKTNLIMNVFYFLILKLLHLIFFSLNHFFPGRSPIRSPYNYLRRFSKWWTLLISSIQCNIMLLGFICFLQFLQTSAFTFIDKINFLLSMLTLFSVLTFSIVFYPLIYRY